MRFEGRGGRVLKRIDFTFTPRSRWRRCRRRLLSLRASRMRLLAGRLELLCHRLSRELMIATFAAALLANAIAITNVFPYAPLMTEWQGMTDDRRELGFYAGFFMAAYQISQMLTSYHLGKLSDTHGRKRVILLGLATCTIPQVLFGLTRNFGVACAIRFAMGLPNAIVGVSKAMGPELFPAHQQVLAMSMISGMWGLGNIVGPSLGGLLSETGPADSLLGDFPYLLPNAICAAFAAVSMVAVARWLPETTGKHAETTATSSSAPAKPAEAAAAAAACLPRNAIPPLIGYFGLAFSAIMFDEIFPLFCVAPAASGGLGLETSSVGGVLTVAGVALVIYMFVLLPRISKRTTISRLFYVSMALCAVCYVAVPALGAAPPAAKWPLLLLAVVLVRFAQAGAFTSIFIMINNSVAAQQRGGVQGLAMAGAAFMRASGPLIGSVSFAWSLTNGIDAPGLDVSFVFLLCGVCSAATGAYALARIGGRYNAALTPARAAAAAELASADGGGGAAAEGGGV